MKKRLFQIIPMVAAALLFGASGCTIEDPAPQIQTPDPIIITASIKGLVQSGVSSLSARTISSPRRSFNLRNTPLVETGCTVKVRDIDTGTVVGTTTTDASGEYVISGLDDGANYEVIVDCAGQKFSTFAKADLIDPTSTAKKVDAVDAESTIIAAYISTAIKEAVGAALASLNGLSQEVIDAVKAAIFDAIDEVIAQISGEIKSAIESGTIVVDDTLADALAESQDAAAGSETSYTDAAVPDPDAIITTDGQDPTILAAAATGSAAYMAFQFACNTTVNSGATVASCTKIIAKTMYGLKETVAVLNGSFTIGSTTVTGAFGSFTCTDVGVADIDGDGNLDFPQAKTQVFSPEPGINFCAVQPRMKAFNRNQQAGERGDDGGMFWYEGPGGLLHSMAVSLINGHRYTLPDINSLVNKSTPLGNDPLTSEPITAGMGVRFLAQSGLDNKFYYQASTGWKAFPPLPGCDWCGSMAPWDLQGIINPDWSVDTTVRDERAMIFNDATAQQAFKDFVDALATSMVAEPTSTFVTDYFVNTFNGKTEAQVADVINNKRIHIDHNPSGQREFWVVYTEQPQWGDVEVTDSTGAVTVVPSPCNDHDPSTPCIGAVSGASEPALRASITKDASGTITGVAAAATGNVLFEPVYSNRGATTALRLLAVVTKDGVTTTRFLRDKYSEPLILFAVTADDVGTNAPCKMANATDPWGAPGANDPSCAEGQFYMVREVWSEDTTSGQWDVSFNRVSNTPVAVTGIVLSDLIQTHFDRVQANAGGVDLWGVLGYFSQEGQTALMFHDGGTGLAQADETTADPKWYIQPYDECTMSGCTPPSKFLFVNASTGAFETPSPAIAGVPFTPLLDPANINGSGATVDCRDLATTDDLYLAINGAGKCADTGIKYWEIQKLMWGQDPANPDWWIPLPNVQVTDWASIQDTTVNAFGGNTTLASVVQRKDIFNGPFANLGWDAALAPFFYDANGNGLLDTAEPTFDNQWDIQWLLGDYLCQTTTSCWDAANFQTVTLPTEMKKIRFVENGWAFGNSVIANKLMGTAFSFDNGILSVTNTDQLTAMQGFATLFLFFSDEAGVVLPGASVTEWNGATSTKDLQLRAEFLNQDDMFDPNKSISGGLCSFRVASVGNAVSCPYPFP